MLINAVKNTPKCVMILLALAGLSNYTYSQGKPKPDPSFERYLLMGRSKMAGRGPIIDVLKDEIDANVLIMNHEYWWVLAKHQLHFDKPKVDEVGPGGAFGIAMAEDNPKIKIGLVPCAVVSTQLSTVRPVPVLRLPKHILIMTPLKE